MVVSGLRWYAVYTESRHEKTVAELLRQKNIGSFLPLCEVMSRLKGRRKRVQFPLFPVYLLVLAQIHEQLLDIGCLATQVIRTACTRICR